MIGQVRIPSVPSDVDLSGKTVIVTGANTGLGLEAARQFLQLKASKVILAVRTVSKGEDAREELLKDAVIKEQNPTAQVKVLKLDLASYDEVIKFVAAFSSTFNELDLLVLNAGMNHMHFARSVNGHEMVLQVNFLSTALLALLLLPVLKKTADTKGLPTRISWVGSQAQRYHGLDGSLSQSGSSILGLLDDQAKYNTWTRYSDSKLLVSMFVEQLAMVTSSDKVIINNLCPGFVQTDIDKDMPIWMKVPLGLARKLFARTVVEGGRSLVFAGVMAGPETHGKFIVDNKIASIASIAATQEGQVIEKKIWNETLAEMAKADLRSTADLAPKQGA